MTLLTQEEAARTLRISKTSLWRLRNRGKYPGDLCRNNKNFFDFIVN
jgi:DNA-binding XRE family transcriptional regulator